MPSETSCNYWVFREGRSTVHGAALLRDVVLSLAELRHATTDRVLDALIRCGELETCLADSGSSDAYAAAALTNAVAALLVGVWNSDTALDCLSEIASQLKIPEQVQLSTAEGFAYYGLHPRAFADTVQRMELRSPSAAVIGIRSIGATLSAVVTATLALRNVRAERITVRPDGHPYDRRAHFSDSQLRWIAAHRSRDAEFIIVDEGPGLSGSSFLSVGEALLQAGVERRRIRFLCSRQTDPKGLVAPNAAQRWSSFDALWPWGTHHLPNTAEHHIGGGEWRMWKYGCESDWPASWTYMERAKYLSKDRQRMFKFIGLGKFGAPVEDRARVLASSGFGPQIFGTSQGYGEYFVVPGRPATRSDLSRAVLDRIAQYCATRATEFRIAHADLAKLEQMIRFNYSNEVGEEPADFHLEGRNFVTADGRMLPHEWVFDTAGNLIKTDGDTHGDDHFFPGPTDIGWDLAGAIVEWGMDQQAREYLLTQYARLTGDPVHRRIDTYVLGYSIFRIGMSMMGAHALRETAEEVRLRIAASNYRRFVEHKPGRVTTAVARPSAADRPAPAA